MARDSKWEGLEAQRIPRFPEIRGRLPRRCLFQTHMNESTSRRTVMAGTAAVAVPRLLDL